ncbi:MAG: class I SAM-dependent methyltransferase [Candidatus Dadabacteria bacterium]|nr:MAG: class I SAM-dependent methyltransferase [Candidatus Dadabacteria bacterium]
MPLSLNSIPTLFNNIDIYLFDLILREKIKEDIRLLDAGTGSGRNIDFLLSQKIKIHAVDSNKEAISNLLARYSRENTAARLSAAVSDISGLPYQDSYFDVVLCIAVLHFAKDLHEFEQQVYELWRVLKPGGTLFIRSASYEGLQIDGPCGTGRLVQFPEGRELFAVDHQYLNNLTERLNGTLIYPLKTVIVDNLRGMCCWCLKKE